VPQVILPVWYDTYDFACRAEYLGIGVWGSRKAAPAVNGPELGQALVQVLASDQSMAMQDKAKTIASQLGPKEGRIIACDKIISILTESTQQSIVPVKKRSVSVET
jgi:UDP:flavonoid glycosyltransferase YjiC (YdhE family)